MGPGLHKLLTHVPQLQEMWDYPIAWSAEEAIESAWKVIRRLLKTGVFTGSPEAVMRSLLHKLLVRSDPLVVHRYIFPNSRLNHEALPTRVKALLEMNA